jgi:signal recognition particle subunit SRP54
MTKLDGDTRGGAALSAKSVTGKPIKFIGVGEKYDALEPFHPERMASRILGMGDVMSLIEKAQENYDEEKAAELERKMKKNEFTLEDFLDQIGQIKKMGGLAKLLDMMPGMNNKAMKDVDLEGGEKEFVQIEAIIQSMTKEERKDPSILNASRRKRIAAGSGQPVSRINNLIKKYDEARKMMKQFSNAPKFKRNQMFRGF